jgi:HEAT repeat protein
LLQLPDSLSYTNLRVRARSLAYASTIGQKHLIRLVEELHRFVLGSDPATRPYLQSVIRSFSSMSSEPRTLITNHLSKLLGHRSGSVRMRVAMALGRLGDKQAIKSLANSLKDKDRYVRREVTSALGQIGDEAARKSLSKAIKDKDVIVGWEAAQALQRIGTNQALETLIRALSDEDWNVRYSAVEALGHFEDCRGTKALFKAIKDVNASVSSIAATMLEKSGGECTTPGFQQMLKDKEIEWRRFAAEQLGKSGDARAIGALLEATESEDQILRCHAVIAVAKLSRNQLRSKESSHSANDEPVYQSSTAHRIKNAITHAIEILIAQLRAPNHRERWHAIATLREIGGNQVAERLHQLIEDGDAKVRLAAAEALIGMCNEHAVDTFLTLLKEGDESTRADAARNLGVFRHKTIVDALLRASKDDSSYVRRWAAESLKSMLDKRAAKLLKPGTVSIDEHGVAALGVLGDRKSLKELVKLLKSKDSTIRRAVTEALGTIGTEETIEPLSEAITDSDPYVRESAAWNLGVIGSEQSIQGLLKAIRDKDYRVQDSATWSLRRIKPEVVNNGLLRALSSEDSYVRRRACQVIGYYSSDKQIIKRVKELAVADPVLSVKRVAKQAANSVSYKFENDNNTRREV